ncbi:MAG: RidA family protein [Xanthomonadaceae bacterium]|nr:RidA family protein [Xanthomonadaceae bacterium]
MSLKKEIIETVNAPKPIGPYSQAVKVGDLLFCSGQVAIEPVSNTVVANDIDGQTKQVMKNIEAVLTQAQMKFSNVVKTTIFLKSMHDFPKVNAIYGEYFTQNPPARSTVEVSRLPKDVLVEIECIASA